MAVRTHNPLAVGSSPTRPTTCRNGARVARTPLAKQGIRPCRFWSNLENMFNEDHVNDVLLRDWELHLKALKRSPSTIETYLRSVREVVASLRRLGHSGDITQVTHRDLETVFVEMQGKPNQRTGKPITDSYVAKHYRQAQQCWRWLAEIEEEIEYNPFAKLKPPKVDLSEGAPIIPDTHITSLLGCCKGNDFMARRNTAIVRGFMDTGVRSGGLASMTREGMNYDHNTALVRLKGGNLLAVPFGAKTAESFRRYERVRGKHPFAASPMFWLGPKGPLNPGALNQLMNRLTAEAGLDHINPHMWRHTFAHNWLLHGGNESDLMRLMGWKSRAMLERYARSAALERARLAHQKAALGDRL